ncbi:MAG: hypothetical protein O8C66_04785 [Candidatus Methanoperedens sp.]|nr:hypothetical protein [Candidatus Methanoperedens sp.]MCZ7369804.1 hypothetical protein [Candidatus Methanoperedens sp.]
MINRRILYGEYSVQTLTVGIIIALMLSSIVVGAGAAPNEEWRKGFSNSEYNQLFHSVQQTKDGGYIIAGQTNQMVENSPYAWLIKTDKNGNQVWSKIYEGFGPANSVLQDKDGGYVILGGDYLIKTDPNGYQQWSRIEGGRSFQQTSDGGYIITKGSELYKTDANGYKQWNKTPPTNFGIFQNYNDIKQTSDGGYLLVGRKNLIKTDANGNEQWNRTIGKVSINNNYFVSQMADGGYIIAGSSMEGDDAEIRDRIIKITYTARPLTAWLIKTDAMGAEQRNTTFGVGTEFVNDFKQTLDGGYVIAATIKSSSSDDVDAALIKIDTNGNEQWNKKFERSFSDGDATSVWQTSDGGYIVTVQESIGENLLIKIGSAGVDATPSAVKTTEIKKTPETTTEAIKTPEVIPTEVIKTPVVTPTETNKPVGQSTPGFGLLAAVFSLVVIFFLKGKKE